MVIFICVVLVLILLLILARMGRTGHPDLRKLRKWAYAHRGLHGNGVPENSMSAFQKALDAGYGIELDVQLSKDGKVVVFHDDTLDRVCGVHARVDDLTWQELSKLRLCETEEGIPLFSEVLSSIAGCEALIVEINHIRVVVLPK